MRKTILYIAMSLDGYIADKSKSVDWLSGDGTEESFDSYSDFIKEVDSVVMGWNTYNQIVTELSPDNWVYKNIESYVITHKNIENQENIVFTSKAPSTLIKELKEEDKEKNIWICGGANIVQQLQREELIDEYIISLIPTLLGDGIRLFSKADFETKLKLLAIKHGDGIIELRYIKRENLNK